MTTISSSKSGRRSPETPDEPRFLWFISQFRVSPGFPERFEGPHLNRPADEVYTFALRL